MQKNRKKWIVVIPLILIIGYFMYDAFTQKSIKDLKGDFKEVAFVRNEQNKGGIIRIYAVTVGDPTYAEYDKCADMFPVNDYASLTKIYFFDANQAYPTTLTLEEPHYDITKYKAVNILKRRGSGKE